MNLPPQRGAVHSELAGCFLAVTIIALQGFTDHRLDGSISVFLWLSVLAIHGFGDLFREMLHLDLLPLAKHYRVFDGVFKLAHVPRPVIPAK